MKVIALFACALLMTVPTVAQVTTTGGTANATKTQTQQQPSNKQKQFAVRPPASSMPAAAARTSTAEGAAARGNKPPLKELPDFAVTARDGSAVQAQALTQSKHWLLIYRADNCLPCDRLMNVLAAGATSQQGQGLAYVIVVAGKDKNGLDRVRAQYDTLTNATWVADSSKQFMTALKPRGFPMLYAMDGSKIAWSVPGNLGNPALVEQMTSSWMANSGPKVSATDSTVNK